jgi:non-ribosomal peptide synthetase component F
MSPRKDNRNNRNDLERAMDRIRKRKREGADLATLQEIRAEIAALRPAALARANDLAELQLKKLDDPVRRQVERLLAGGTGKNGRPRKHQMEGSNA